MRVLTFLIESGFVFSPSTTVAMGTPDESAVRRIQSFTDIGLFLLPFHAHRARDGSSVDGLSLLGKLPPEVVATRAFIMPVNVFSASAQFPRRVQEALALQPALMANVVVMPENEIGSPRIRSELAIAIARTTQ